MRGSVSILSCYAAGLLGALFVSAGVGTWYDALAKPWFYPPTWTFAPVWLVLYACMAAALYIVWSADPDASEAKGWVPLFFAHLCANACWTILFFGFHSVLIALIDMLCLLVAVALLLLGSWNIDRRATFFLAPYFAWVCFAAVLNASIWYLN